MSIGLTQTEIGELQAKYSYLINYESEDPTESIDPISYRDSNSDHLIHIAASGADLRTVELLLRAGVDVNMKGDMGSTPLHYASREGNCELIELLLRHGADELLLDDFGRRPSDYAHSGRQ